MRKKYHPKTKIELRKLILDEEIELSEIDTSKITDMSHLFEPTLSGGEQARFFFEGIEDWDVSNVTDMSSMFRETESFDQDISNWNVRRAKTESMFFYSSCNSNYRPRTANRKIAIPTLQNRPLYCFFAHFSTYGIYTFPQAKNQTPHARIAISACGVWKPRLQ